MTQFPESDDNDSEEDDDSNDDSNEDSNDDSNDDNKGILSIYGPTPLLIDRSYNRYKFLKSKYSPIQKPISVINDQKETTNLLSLYFFT